MGAPVCQTQAMLQQQPLVETRQRLSHKRQELQTSGKSVSDLCSTVLEQPDAAGRVVAVVGIPLAHTNCV